METAVHAVSTEATAMAMGEETVPSWDHRELTRFRKAHGFTKMEMVRQLQRLPELVLINWSTYSRWESGAVTPRPIYQMALRKAMRQIEEAAPTSRRRRSRRAED